MQNYRELTVWQKSMDLVADVYKTSKKLPKEERFALTDQICRAAVSIPSNIVEGYGRLSSKEYLHFLSIARGSKYELETQLLLCVRIGYLQENEIENLLISCDEIGKMLNAMIKKLQNAPNP